MWRPLRQSGQSTQPSRDCSLDLHAGRHEASRQALVTSLRHALAGKCVPPRAFFLFLFSFTLTINTRQQKTVFARLRSAPSNLCDCAWFGFESSKGVVVAQHQEVCIRRQASVGNAKCSDADDLDHGSWRNTVWDRLVPLRDIDAAWCMHCDAREGPAVCVLRQAACSPLLRITPSVWATFPIFYAILMRNHCIIIGNVVEGRLCAGTRRAPRYCT